MRVIRFALLLLACTAAPALAQDPPPEAGAIRDILATGAPPVTDIDAAVGAESLAALRQVYATRDNRPIWFATPEAPAAHALLDRLAQPDMTVGAKLQPLLDAARARIAFPDIQARAGADLLLTALYGATARAMRKDAPTSLPATLDELNQASDVVALLQEPQPPKIEDPAPEKPKLEIPKAETPTAETPNVEPAALPAVAPEPAPVARLRAAIAALQPLAETGWPKVPDGPKLQLGDSGPRVEALSKRLIASGDSKAAPGPEFDMPLQTALRHFQARHGLPDDGVAGAGTIAALNVPVKDRLATMTVNLHRLEREGVDWGDRYLVLNIAAGTYLRIEAGHAAAAGPAIFGAPATPTPLLDAAIDRVVLHPSWRIPQPVADRLLWPRQEEDATYFYNHGIHVTDDGLKQDPGSGNPLGPVKLLIAGNDRIALHGAPGKDAFAAPDRHNSLGCIALADIAALAKDLLAADPAWPEGRIDGMLAAGGTQTVALAKPLPIHIVYQTAWVDEDGTLQFRDDVYGWDKQMPAADATGVADPCGS